MAESQASLTSDKPPTQKLGLGLLIPDTAPFDPTTTDQGVKIESPQNAPDAGTDSPPEGSAKGVMEETENACEEAELGLSIEKEFFQLTILQAEIEAASNRSEGVDAEGEGNSTVTVKEEIIDEEKNEKGSESVHENEGDEEGNGVKIVQSDHHAEEKDDDDAESTEEENENQGYDEDERKVGGQFGEEETKSARHNYVSNRRTTNYPMRPDAEDCAYYMKFGTCKFASYCKFNHPPRRKNQGVKEKAKDREENSEKAGQTECKYYLTSGGCRYGEDCKYSHNSDKSSTFNNPSFNFLGLPIRPGEKECPYYMRTGSCKYGSNCRFHHPEPTAVVGVGSTSGYDNGGSFPSQFTSSSSISSWSSPRALTDNSPFVPVIFPPTQGTPAPNTEWNGYQAAPYPRSERNLPTPPAFAMNNLPTEINFPMQQQHDMVVEEYPERPGEPDCSFFLKTGDCKFKFNCKFNHPKNRNIRAKANSFTLNDEGLPLRPDQPICTHYHRYGICKYGPACKYDHHPSKFGIAPPTPLDNQPPPFGHPINSNETESSV